MKDLWCCKCKRKMEPAEDIQAVYGYMPLPKMPGMRCPECGVELIRKEIILGDLATAEAMLAGK